MPLPRDPLLPSRPDPAAAAPAAARPSWSGTAAANPPGQPASAHRAWRRAWRQTLRQARRLACAAACGSVALAAATAAPSEPPELPDQLPDELAALELEGAPDEPPRTAAATRVALEAMVGTAQQRYGQDSGRISRYSLDAQHRQRLGEGLRAVLSARVDSTHPKDPRLDNPVLSLRQAYLGWQNESATQLVDVGRVSLRNGPGYGYNPTDFLRDGSLRTVVSVNPLAQRENRLGSVMLRWQHLGPVHGVSLLVSPKLQDRASTHGMSADWGATNARTRGLATWSLKLGDNANSQVLLYKPAGQPLQWGANFTALVTDSLVAHGEWSRGREPTLLARAQAGAAAAPAVSGQRAAAGLTWSSARQFSVTLELQHNGFALSREDWRALAGTPLPAWAAYHLAVQDRQDIASRRALLLYASQKDLGMRGLDLTGFVRFNGSDDSRMSWLELRWRRDGHDLALQWLDNRGSAEAEFGLSPIKESLGVLLAAYF